MGGVLIYGATGYTGQLVSRRAKEIGMSPILAGRNEAKVRAVAEPLGFQWRVADVDDPAALTRALEDPSQDVRATAVGALGARGDEASLPRLVAALRDESAEIRSRAAWAIGSIEPDDAPAALADALRDSEEDVRLRAAWAIGQIADAALLPALSAALDRESSDEVREAELRAMLMMGERDEAALARLIESGSAEIRSQAVAALAGRSLRPWPWPWPWPQPRPFP